MFLNEVQAIQLSSAIAAGGVLISASEDLRNHIEFSDSGLFSWPVVALDGVPPRLALMRTINRLVFSFESFLLLACLRILGALALILCSILLEHPVPLITAGLAIAAGLMLMRCGYGTDGADQMFVVVLTGLTVAAAFPRGHLGARFGLWFIAAQLTLSYMVSGIAKIAGPRWRDGSGLAGVLSTDPYGWRWISRIFAKHRLVSRAASWAVIVWEVTFVLAWFMPGPVAMVYLGLGVLFHISVGVIMGLNNFVFAFLAAYPITYLCMTSTWH